MSTERDYQRIAQAIEYIHQNFMQQPSLAEIAAQVHLSPAHFQRLFSQWAGTSPKKFLQYTSLAYAKQVLQHSSQNAILDATYATGLSSSSRLHDLFIQIEGMTPAEYQQSGKQLTMKHWVYDTPFGAAFIASTTKGICALSFDNRMLALQQLQTQFPNADFQQAQEIKQQQALAIFMQNEASLPQLKLHLKASEFQLKVWESLLKIPQGALCSYASIAQQIGQPKASRAVGTAIGRNPVAFLIPCHRVIQASGILGGYRWGITRKAAIIAWEAAQQQP
ncbi:bifunctional transcriptional activator/DNA repair enzyme AdaA [Acinetobacter sp. ANC 5383]